jgi:heme exporter protein B
VSGPRVALEVFRKDLRLDLRSRDRLVHMAVFALLVVALLSIVVPGSKPERSAWSPPLLWVVLLFTSLLGLARSSQAETEEGAIELLIQAPVDRGWVFFGKALASLVALFGVEVWAALLFTVFLDIDWSAGIWGFAAAGLLGAIGLAAPGTLLSTISLGARFREFLFPVLFFPLVLPVLVFASRITADSLAGRESPGLVWAIFVLYDWVSVLLGYFLFDYVLED